ncbi:MAG TPA: zf-HC2 domain-containing protein, partial [Steroidobacteraceae bacterium]|nr:zf-HC2 domain-containing protein [Steroidobacteraceae bacterium]
MSISNERLMAYVDGELDSAARAEVEAAMSGDTEFEQRIAKYRELRDKLKAAYESELAEPVPERLLAILRADSAA